MIMNTHNKTSLFHSRYFERNAEQRLLSQLLEFMLWRRGKFLLPTQRDTAYRAYLDEERNNFAKGHINLPQLQFLLTTRCSLRCANCNAYMPYFGGSGAPHWDLSLEDFRQDLAALEGAVHSIRRFMFIGGEPLLHPALASMLEIAAASPIVDVIEVITNGTLVPRADVLEVAERLKDRVYFHISNYAGNPQLRKLLKHEALQAALKEHGIRWQMAPEVTWYREQPLSGCHSEEDTRQLFSSCWLKRCLQVMDGKIAVCPKASSAYALGMADVGCVGEVVDLRHEGNLREALLAFYSRDFFQVCRSCTRLDEKVLPAEQMQSGA